MTIVEAARGITGGIDTHGEVHVAAALDEVGGLLGTESFDATPEGYAALLSWLAGFGVSARSAWKGPAPMAQASPASSPEPVSR